MGVYGVITGRAGAVPAGTALRLRRPRARPARPGRAADQLPVRGLLARHRPPRGLRPRQRRVRPILLPQRSKEAGVNHRVVLFGASGFIGGHVRAALGEADPGVETVALPPGQAPARSDRWWTTTGWSACWARPCADRDGRGGLRRPPRRHRLRPPGAATPWSRPSCWRRPAPWQRPRRAPGPAGLRRRVRRSAASGHSVTEYATDAARGRVRRQPPGRHPAVPARGGERAGRRGVAAGVQPDRARPVG